MIVPLVTHVERSLVDPRPSVRSLSSASLAFLTSWLSDYMIYTRGAKDDWNRYAELTGDDGWKWDSVLEYAKKVRLLICSATIFQR